MDRILARVVEPLLEALCPRTVVWAGALPEEELTRLQDRCVEASIDLHWICSSSRTIETESKAEAGALRHHGCRLLNALPRIEQPDLVILDDDPNWYTITQALRGIERQARRDGRPMPVVVIRGISGPFARRDGYRDPESIPAADRHELAPGDHDGLRKAAPTGGERNGVLTALEDFVRDAQGSIDLLALPGFGGLGWLVPHDADPAIARLIESLRPAELLAAWLEGLDTLASNAEADRRDADERARVARGRVRQAARAARARAREALEIAEQHESSVKRAMDERDLAARELATAREALSAERARHHELHEAWAREREVLRDELEARSEDARTLEEDQGLVSDQLIRREAEIEELEALLREGDATFSAIRERLLEVERGFLAPEGPAEEVHGNGHRNGDAHESDSSLESGNGEAHENARPVPQGPAYAASDAGLSPDDLIESLDNLVRSRQGHVLRTEVLSGELGQLSERMSTLTQWFDRLESSVGALLRSRRWKVGDAIGQVGRRLARKPTASDDIGSIGEILSDYKDWRGTRDAAIEVVRMSPTGSDPSGEADVDTASPTTAAIATSAHGVGLFDPRSARLLVKYSLVSGTPDDELRLKRTGEGTLITGRFDPGGGVGLGYFDPTTSTFHLKHGIGAGLMNVAVRFGARGAGCIPLVGDWNGDGQDTIGLYDPAQSSFHLRDSLSAGPSHHDFRFGPRGSGWLPVVGDWDGDGRDEIGLYDPVHSRFHLRFELASGDDDRAFHYGAADAGMLPISGDWTGRGASGVGLYDPARGEFHLRHEATSGDPDLSLRTPAPDGDWLPIVGRWGTG